MRGRLIKNLSKGYKQRVGLSQALIGTPPVLILDEPTIGLDPQQIIETRNLIRELGKEHTIILSSHILPEVQAVCTRVLIINKGRIVASDTPENLSRGLVGGQPADVAHRCGGERCAGPGARAGQRREGGCHWQQGAGHGGYRCGGPAGSGHQASAVQRAGKSRISHPDDEVHGPHPGGDLPQPHHGREGGILTCSRYSVESSGRYFISPIGFTFVGFFILLAGVFFAISNLLSGNPNFTGVLGSLTFIFLFLVPILTMRLISEETRQKTDQLLITSPLGITGIVVGKYFAAVGVFVITLLITLIYPVIMSFFALVGLGWWEILGGYIGFFLLGSGFIAVGLFFSSLTDNQLIAAVETFAALLLIWILDFIAQSVPSDAVSGLVFLALLALALVALVFFSTRSTPAAVLTLVVAAVVLVLLFVLKRSFYDGLIARILNWFSLLKRYNDFSMGVLGLTPIVYYVSFSGAFVFLTVRMIERRRWI